MKLSRFQVQRKTHKVPDLRFEDQRLTSYAGLLIFQLLFAKLDLHNRLRRALRPFAKGKAYGLPKVVLILITHLLLGFRHLREIRFYRDDPMVLRLVKLKMLPDVATISRALKQANATGVLALRQLGRQLVLEPMMALAPSTLTLDFDGSVLSTERLAEGTAVGFNKKRKGQRSYYPLFCTLAQTGQVFDVLHRPGNVHDSRQAREFISDSICHIQNALPRVRNEIRMDSAFFADDILSMLEPMEIDYTVTVPFARFTGLKSDIETCEKWIRINDDVSYFEPDWKPKKWHQLRRILVVRSRTHKRRQGPIQLDLFEPYVEGYDFKVIVTNKPLCARKLIAFHDGRGSQEAIFGEMKSQGQLDYVPTRTLAGNQIFMLCVMLAHNLNRLLQISTRQKDRKTTEKRSPLWCFEQLRTMRRTLLHKAGRLTKPQGNLTLTLSANKAVRERMLHYVDQLKDAA